jgi:hypothetical protein
MAVPSAGSASSLVREIDPQNELHTSCHPGSNCSPGLSPGEVAATLTPQSHSAIPAGKNGAVGKTVRSGRSTNSADARSTRATTLMELLPRGDRERATVVSEPADSRRVSR